ncbi:4-hydroxy 2-oxovalerate aldolase [Sporomusaceae bacterium BoRhaA]|uniref:4-hydroxy-2-oxovalerate aldolase n=1 Tax=Pelorhabdus rhamnosifermentans TaxID=2772457 RepID=UPI001C061EE6|nr:4-hydroxy-2-oxovalerate aldolase [Pelorhabdus rhamnosifermentans]MBU2702617.1 4-hydroxy 2-oxovalerate aldolase [Pelorhabdus rhamnosifermentans]
MKIMDCTLRDGANVVGKGFPGELTTLIIKGLIASHVKTIEFGHATGLGATENGAGEAPLSDEEYLDLVAPYAKKAELGMFLLAKNATPKSIKMAADKKLCFLRVGANAGDADQAEAAIKMVRDAGLSAKYSIMKAYVLSPAELAEEAAKLEIFGVQAITIMDSAGYMLPQQAFAYTKQAVEAVKVPVGFHGHNNLGLAVANAIAAEEAGAEFIDCGLMGMARSAGNISTEAVIAAFQRLGKAKEYALYDLLSFIENELRPKMIEYGYHDPIPPLDLVLGYSGCHSSFVPLFKDVSTAKGVNLYKLIVATSIKNRKCPTKELMESTADRLLTSK